MDKNTYSIIGSNKSKETVERLATSYLLYVHSSLF